MTKQQNEADKIFAFLNTYPDKRFKQTDLSAKFKLAYTALPKLLAEHIARKAVLIERVGGSVLYFVPTNESNRLIPAGRREQFDFRPLSIVRHSLMPVISL